MSVKTGHIHFIIASVVALFFWQCNNEPDVPEQDPYNPMIGDDYSNIASLSYSSLWGPYNLHDPSIIKHNGYYYIFSTDVAYGPNGKCGIMWRRSPDLVRWAFLGWVFNGVPPAALTFMEANQPGYQQLSIWAPFIMKAGDTYRLYYSVPGNNGVKLACIALATSSSPEGPWTDEGIVISCLPSDDFNAIDPSVVIDKDNGRHWMSYGSYSSGIHLVELDPATGKLKTQGDTGILIAKRTDLHDAIEGGELLYNPELDKYFLFVSYDWLEDNYNVRVGRADSPEGPYLDINGNDMAAAGDNFPMMTAKYRFDNHSGWQGFGHNAVLNESGKYFYVSQARLGSDIYCMDLHIHRMMWGGTGWPTISPERYVNVPQTTVSSSDLEGKWEHIELLQTANFNESVDITLESGGSIDGIPDSEWIWQNNLLSLSLSGGAEVFNCHIINEWDWENKQRTLVYTGMTNNGKNCWGKKTERFVKE